MKPNKYFINIFCIHTQYLSNFPKHMLTPPLDERVKRDLPFTPLPFSIYNFYLCLGKFLVCILGFFQEVSLIGLFLPISIYYLQLLFVLTQENFLVGFFYEVSLIDFFPLCFTCQSRVVADMIFQEVSLIGFISSFFIVSRMAT